MDYFLTTANGKSKKKLKNHFCFFPGFLSMATSIA